MVSLQSRSRAYDVARRSRASMVVGAFMWESLAPPRHAGSDSIAARIRPTSGAASPSPEPLELVDGQRRGAYQLESFSAEDLGHAKRIMERYADLRIGLACEAARNRRTSR